MRAFEDFVLSFQNSIFTWDYFVDFDKVKMHVKKVEKELNLLNYLIGKENIEVEFVALIKEYPQVKKALPLLIAVRANKLQEMPIISNTQTLESQHKSDIFYGFNLDEKELLEFFKASGLKDIFENKHIKNVVDYCFGIEVGMDTNARKNRTGDLMEKFVGEYLYNFCKQYPHFIFIKQATKSHIKSTFNYNIQMDKSNRRFDFALYNKKIEKLFLIEVNYYSGGGSKLKATAGEYQYLNDFLKAQEIAFVWITDGKGWLTALKALEETYEHNDFVLNLFMLQKGILGEIASS